MATPTPTATGGADSPEAQAADCVAVRAEIVGVSLHARVHITITRYYGNGTTVNRPNKVVCAPHEHLVTSRQRNISVERFDGTGIVGTGA